MLVRYLKIRIFASHKRIKMKNEQLPTVADLATIRTRIYNVRGKNVMIDKDLAVLYGVETKRINEQVRRNKERFPEDFMFQLTKEGMFKVAICDLERKTRRKHKIYAVCVHRVRCGDVE